MASTSLTLTDYAAANVVFTLAGQTQNGAIFKVASRSLTLPRTMEFQYNLGNPGSLGNDKLIITFSDTVQNSTTGKVVTARAKLEVSVPRDSAVTETVTSDLLAMLRALITNGRIDNVVDGIVP